MLLACLSTATVGPYVWANFPTLRILLQMLITNHYEFPPLVDTQTPAIIVRSSRQAM